MTKSFTQIYQDLLNIVMRNYNVNRFYRNLLIVLICIKMSHTANSLKMVQGIPGHMLKDYEPTLILIINQDSGMPRALLREFCRIRPLFTNMYY